MLRRALASVSEKRKRRPSQPFSILCALMLMISASARAGQNILYYFSEPGDYIGQGAEVTFTGTDGTFSVAPTFNNGISASFIAPGFAHWWS